MRGVLSFRLKASSGRILRGISLVKFGRMEAISPVRSSVLSVFGPERVRVFEFGYSGPSASPHSVLHWHDEVFHNVIFAFGGVAPHVKRKNIRRIGLGRSEERRVGKECR